MFVGIFYNIAHLRIFGTFPEFSMSKKRVYIYMYIYIWFPESWVSFNLRIWWMLRNRCQAMRSGPQTVFILGIGWKSRQSDGSARCFDFPYKVHMAKKNPSNKNTCWGKGCLFHYLQCFWHLRWLFGMFSFNSIESFWSSIDVCQLLLARKIISSWIVSHIKWKTQEDAPQHSMGVLFIML